MASNEGGSSTIQKRTSADLAYQTDDHTIAALGCKHSRAFKKNIVKNLEGAVEKHILQGVLKFEKTTRHRLQEKLIARGLKSEDKKILTEHGLTVEDFRKKLTQQKQIFIPNASKK